MFATIKLSWPMTIEKTATPLRSIKDPSNLSESLTGYISPNPMVDKLVMAKYIAVKVVSTPFYKSSSK